ncbi:MAG: hypothetical protein WBE38_03600, partial [Terracidiphilus sp.]
AELSLHFDTNVRSLQHSLYDLSNHVAAKGRGRPGIDFASDDKPREVVVFFSTLIELEGDGAESNISSSRQQLDTIQPLLDQLPDSQRERDRYRSLQEETKTKLDQVTKFDEVVEDAHDTDDMASVANMTDQPALALAKKRREQEKSGEELDNSASSTAAASERLVEDIVSAAKIQKHRAETRYVLFTYLSFVLYPLGVFIALIGQYYGEDVADVGNE